MAKRKRAIPQYGTVVLNGIEYYRTRIEDSDGNRVALYLAGHENSKTTMDIYARVKYNKPEQLFDVVNSAFHQAVPS